MSLSAIHPEKGIYVFQFPVRLWHWVTAVCIFTLFITGHFIGKPPQSLTGDPTYVLYFGYLIRAHYCAGMVLVIAMLCRIVWAFVGNSFSRQIFIIPFWKKAYWVGVWNVIKWYLFLKKTPSVEMGHNPLARLAMFGAVIGIIFMCLTGLGIYQAKGFSPTLHHLFGFMENFVYWCGGNGIDLVLLHRMGMVLLVVFVMCHVYMVIREEIMGSTTLLSTMVNGFRLVRKVAGRKE